MGQILLLVMLLKSVYWRCFLIYARSRCPSDTCRIDSWVCVFWHASSDLLRLSWKCQPEICSLQQPDKISVQRVWSGTAPSLSRLLGKFIQGFMVPPQDPEPWRGEKAPCRLKQQATSRRSLNGLCSPESSSRKGLTILLLPEITQKSLLLCRFLLCWHTRNSTSLCNMVQRFSKIKISFLIWGQSLVPSITAKGDLLHSPLTSRKLLVKKSIYSAWIMGTRVWLLITQAWQLRRCYSVQYYSKVSIFISNKMLTS